MPLIMPPPVVNELASTVRTIVNLLPLIYIQEHYGTYNT